MEIKKRTIKCWICKDSGLVIYSKFKDDLEYEFAYKCTCVLGQRASSNIITVPDIVAENLALENYKNFESIEIERFPELILEAKEICKLVGQKI